MNESPSQSLYTPRKFYFIEYFYIFLTSVQRARSDERAFEDFRELKEERGLGESKFRRQPKQKENPTPRQLERFRYTFNQVAEESRDYELVVRLESGAWEITTQGKELLASYGTSAFRYQVLKLMENRYGAFSYLIRTMYAQNPNNGGLLVFPLYSPLDLNIAKREIRTAKDIAVFGEKLRKRIAADCKTLADRELNLPDANRVILPKLRDDGKLPENDTAEFDPTQYNAIISRFRKFWFSYLLKEVYRIGVSESTFELWAYRGKQLGTINVSEYFPGMSGRIAYPLAVVGKEVRSKDFTRISYNETSDLWLHEPSPDFLDAFVDNLTNAYVNQRRSASSYFTSLYVVREIVCLKCRISERTFELFLNEAYERSLREQLRIRISLEVDRTPGETSATYRRREPIFVRTQSYNIIGLDFASSMNHG